jgi:hypothetical protein
MTRRERRALFGGAVVLAIVCSALFARAVFAQRAADYAHDQVRAAILASPAAPTPDLADRTMLSWTGATGQVHYWQALQRFRLVTGRATEALQYSFAPSFALIFDVEQTETYLRQAAVEAGTSAASSRLYDMLGLTYYADAELHAGQFPVEPALEAKAIGAFQEAVLADGTNDAAKTNLELLLRRQLRRQKATPQPTKGVQDTQRAESQSADPSGGLPMENGSIGPRFRGGF